MKASEFVQQVQDVRIPQLSALGLGQLVLGNTPRFMNQTYVCFTEAVVDGGYYRCEYQVLPQYLCIGQDDDFVQWPLSIVDLQQYCDINKRAWFIPPKKIVYNTWLFSECKIAPQPLGASAKMTWASEIWREQQKINDAMRANGCDITAFSRAKKAYITAPNMDGQKLHFTGWYSLEGDAIQKGDATGNHEASYADYSHGCDLVGAETYVNGLPFNFGQLCQHPKLHVLVSDQGPFNPVFPNKGAVSSLVAGNEPEPKKVPSSFQGPVYQTLSSQQVPTLLKAGVMDAPDGPSDGQGFRTALGFGISALGLGLLYKWQHKH